MSEFDKRAREWDNDKMHMERSVAIASELEKMIPLENYMNALEYGAGTGILSFLLMNRFSAITLMDSSNEMIKVCLEKVAYYQTRHILPLCINLEKIDYQEKFDVIYNQMVLHHVNDVPLILHKFYDLLNKAGYLAIADLYTEDGSFHGPDVKVHLGFDPDKLTKTLISIGFRNIEYKTCFEVKRESGDLFPVFLIVAQK